MKTTMILLATMLFSVGVNSQENISGKNAMRQAVTYPERVKEQILQSVYYPRLSKFRNKEGIVIIEFAINPNGELSDLRVINSVSPELDRVALKAMEKTRGKWEPFVVKGKPVKMFTEISVKFKLYPDSDFSAIAKQYFQLGNKILHKRNNPKRALRFFNNALKYMPYEESILQARALCKLKLGDHEGASNDVARAEKLIIGKDMGFRTSVVKN